MMETSHRWPRASIQWRIVWDRWQMTDLPRVSGCWTRTTMFLAEDWSDNPQRCVGEYKARSHWRLINTSIGTGAVLIVGQWFAFTFLVIVCCMSIMSIWDIDGSMSSNNIYVIANTFNSPVFQKSYSRLSLFLSG